MFVNEVMVLEGRRPADQEVWVHMLCESVVCGVCVRGAPLEKLHQDSLEQSMIAEMVVESMLRVNSCETP